MSNFGPSRLSFGFVAVLSASFFGCGGEIGAGGRPGGGGGGVGGNVVATGSAGTVGAAGTTAGAGGGDPSGGGGAAGSVGGGCSADGVPADVANLLALRCLACHGNPPLVGVPASLATYASLTSTSKGDPTKTNAALALSRMQNAAMPMPPAPLSPATAAEIATLQAWVTAGAPKADCASVDGGASPDAAPPIDPNAPFAVAPKCSSGKTWTGGDRGSDAMYPGRACVSCHATTGGEAPLYTIAGTLYPTGHEPDSCDGVAGTTAGAKVVIVGADKKSITLSVNAAGNFFFEGAVATPYQAKVVYMGRERAMIEPQTSGDCNACHTQNGTKPAGSAATALTAPGRVVLP